MKWKLHRSPGLWGGLVVMMAVLWGWCDSMWSLRVVNRDSLSAMSVGGGICLQGSANARAGINFSKERIDSIPGAHARVWWSAPMYLRKDGSGRQDEEAMKLFFLLSGTEETEPIVAIAAGVLMFGRPGEWILFVPYWMVLLPVLLIWAGWLVWRWRRMRRAQGRIG